MSSEKVESPPGTKDDPECPQERYLLLPVSGTPTKSRQTDEEREYVTDTGPSTQFPLFVPRLLVDQLLPSRSFLRPEGVSRHVHSRPICVVCLGAKTHKYLIGFWYHG